MVLDQHQLSNPKVGTAFQLNLIRRRFLESISVILLILGMIGLPLSISRIYHSDLNLNHINHCCTSVAILGVFLLRKKLSDRWLLSLLLLIFTSLSLAAFLQYGIVSAGFYFSAASIFIAGMAGGWRGGVICAFFYSMIFAVTAYLWIFGHLTFPGDVRKYILMPTVWALFSVSFIITSAVFFISATVFISKLKELVCTIYNQKQKIEEQTAELTRTNKELEETLSKVKTLYGLLPICAKCKKIRDDRGYWNQIEQFIADHTEVSFSHSICPECLDKLYGDEEWYKKKRKTPKS